MHGDSLNVRRGMARAKAPHDAPPCTCLPQRRDYKRQDKSRRLTPAKQQPTRLGVASTFTLLSHAVNTVLIHQCAQCLLHSNFRFRCHVSGNVSGALTVCGAAAYRVEGEAVYERREWVCAEFMMFMLGDMSCSGAEEARPSQRRACVTARLICSLTNIREMIELYKRKEISWGGVCAGCFIKRGLDCSVCLPPL
ncbi:hypothetical protein E2C01_039076 [Portunus trituberculatus]|uniref:Uncharacterized protein n=1 Tax=Portunus trituberculatus TaxID=210409 RepID=A0A5B7FIM0_PORTR|nr:hypothetical protein [Portunus trituberculatus]